MNSVTSVKGAHWTSFCGANMPQLSTVCLADGVDFGEESDEVEDGEAEDDKVADSD